MRSSEIAIGAKVRVKKDMISQLKSWEQSAIQHNGVPHGEVIDFYAEERRRTGKSPLFLWVDCSIAKGSGQMPLRVPMHYLELDK